MHKFLTIFTEFVNYVKSSVSRLNADILTTKYILCRITTVLHCMSYWLNAKTRNQSTASPYDKNLSKCTIN
jgi:hypothetical protein